ncbi:hypothetical protein HPB47_027372 [Ixodes persulcatus]|uniref:Uncharacterized protein n=1 Tax=Ixodes persulcatus TaxID=34615 RepID=A0AC60PWN9_IXOPE|nr:hypothetical protein HPB47_027372 [Ixodes persulcatus]
MRESQQGSARKTPQADISQDRHPEAADTRLREEPGRTRQQPVELTKIKQMLEMVVAENPKLKAEVAKLRDQGKANTLRPTQVPLAEESSSDEMENSEPEEQKKRDAETLQHFGEKLSEMITTQFEAMLAKFFESIGTQIAALNDRVTAIEAISSRFTGGGGGTRPMKSTKPYARPEIHGLNHSLYADDVTLWVAGGSDGHVQDTLQQAINAVEGFVHTTDTTCEDLCRSCADVVECRRHQNMVKSAVQTTLAPGTCPPQSRPSLRRGSRDISCHVIAMFLAARGQCCRTEPNDNLDAYLQRFERTAAGLGWAQEKWATALSLCLPWEALTVVGRSTPAAAFRDAKPEGGETRRQFAARLSGYFDRWVEVAEQLAGADGSLNDPAEMNGPSGKCVKGYHECHREHENDKVRQIKVAEVAAAGKMGAAPNEAKSAEMPLNLPQADEARGVKISCFLLSSLRPLKAARRRRREAVPSPSRRNKTNGKTLYDDKEYDPDEDNTLIKETYRERDCRKASPRRPTLHIPRGMGRRDRDLLTRIMTDATRSPARVAAWSEGSRSGPCNKCTNDIKEGTTHLLWECSYHQRIRTKFKPNYAQNLDGRLHPKK